MKPPFLSALPSPVAFLSGGMAGIEFIELKGAFPGTGPSPDAAVFSNGGARRARAFTLLEIIAVVAIMTLLLSLAAPIVNQALMANQITIGAQTVVDQLNLARQTALTRNRVVETRFYKFTSSENVDKTEQTRALQNFIFDETNTHSAPLDEVHYLPDAAVVSSVSTYSSILQSNREKTAWSGGDAKLSLPRGIDKNYTVYAIRFRPDGSTDLGAGSWFATVRGVNGPGTLPANYATIHIDPYNGSLRLYRPGQ